MDVSEAGVEDYLKLDPTRLTAGRYPSFLTADAGLTRNIPDDITAHLALQAILSLVAVSRPHKHGYFS
jgi:hypothetical protein